MIRAALVALALAACRGSSGPPAPASGSAGPRIEAEGAPKCDFTITVPPLPTATATADASGAVHLVVFAYVQVPVTSTVSASSSELQVEVVSTAAEEVYCQLSYKITGAATLPSSVLVHVRHGGGRPLTELRAPIR